MKGYCHILPTFELQQSFIKQTKSAAIAADTDAARQPRIFAQVRSKAVTFRRIEQQKGRAGRASLSKHPSPCVLYPLFVMSKFQAQTNGCGVFPQNGTAVADRQICFRILFDAVPVLS